MNNRRSMVKVLNMPGTQRSTFVHMYVNGTKTAARKKNELRRTFVLEIPQDSRLRRHSCQYLNLWTLMFRRGAYDNTHNGQFIQIYGNLCLLSKTTIYCIQQCPKFCMFWSIQPSSGRQTCSIVDCNKLLS